MSNAIHNNFRLLGYKINEFSNGYFITQKYDGTESLFDYDGNIIINSMRDIKRVTNDLYSYKDNDTYGYINNIQLLLDVLVDKHGNVLGSGNGVKSMLTEFACMRVGIAYNIYSNDGTKIFNRLEAISLISVVYVSGEYKAVVRGVTKTDKEGINYTNRYSIVNTSGHRQQLTDMASITVNNHYIKGTRFKAIDGEMHRLNTVINYEGETIYSDEEEVIIDTANLDNNAIIIIKNDTIRVIRGEEETNIRNSRNSRNINDTNKSYKVEHVDVTSDKDIICVTDKKGSYLLNIRTHMKSEYFHSICTVPLIPVVRNGNTHTLCKIDADTLKVSKILDINTQTDKANIREHDIVVINKETLIQTHYDFDGNVLAHEFRNSI